MNTRLTAAEKKLLGEVIRRRKPALLPVVSSLGDRRLSIEEREEIRELLAEEMCEAGLGEGDEPNERGLSLDGLIGRLMSF